MELPEIDRRWFKSHELFWGYKQPDESAEEYIQKAVKPLLDSGRVPILITDLDPATDMKTIQEIIQSDPKVLPGETILLRLALKSVKSIKPAVSILKKLFAGAKAKKQMPRWWPLLQAEFDIKCWKMLKKELGSLWKYTNIAMTPFMTTEVILEVKDQITVAQFFLGEEKEICANGDMIVNLKTCAGLSAEKMAYNLFDYAKEIKNNQLSPTCIICSPSKSSWSIQKNQKRLKKYIRVFENASETLWSHSGNIMPNL